MNSRQRCGDRVDGTPMLGGEKRQADLSSGEGDVRMRDSSIEGDSWWIQWIVGWDKYTQTPEAAFIRRTLHTL